MRVGFLEPTRLGLGLAEYYPKYSDSRLGSNTRRARVFQQIYLNFFFQSLNAVLVRSFKVYYYSPTIKKANESKVRIFILIIFFLIISITHCVITGTMSKKKVSKVWDYFTELPSYSKKAKAKCIQCKSQIAIVDSSTSSLFKHSKIHNIFPNA